jgi:hypothetical protein
MNLEELQRTMGAAVMEPLTADEQMQAKDKSGKPMDEVAGAFIQPNSRLTAFERLEIYNRQYWFRLQGAFAEDFPALRAVVGSSRFEKLTNAYLEANPSRSFTLRNLGSNLFEWLTANPSFAGRRLSLALDVVRVEWACIEAFDNASIVPLQPAELAAFHGESQLALQPHVRLLALEYPADDLVLAMHRHEKKEVSEAGARPEFENEEFVIPIQLRKQPTWLAIHRSDLSLYYKRLTKPEYRTLIALQQNATLSEALDTGFADSRASVATRVQSVQAWFANWAELGWLCNPDRNAPKEEL